MEDFLIVVVEKLFFMPFLMGLVFVITALISLRFPPKKSIICTATEPESL